MGVAASQEEATVAVIPKPQMVRVGSGVLRIGREFAVGCAQTRALRTAEYLAAEVGKLTGGCIRVTEDITSPVNGLLSLKLTDAEAETGGEGYRLHVSAKGACLAAASEAGLFYGAHSLLQLVQNGNGTAEAKECWEIPAVEIVDRPRFGWRGAMLDVSRHFFSVREIKRYLDAMAFYKLNVFHWHLTDDGGWRIEIKRHPRLTEVGAWREGIGFGLDAAASSAYDASGRYGGYYSQDEIREVVAYAQSRHISVVPEIELPGHATAALVAYPELSCTGGPFRMQSEAQMMRDVFCAGSEGPFKLLEQVLGEVTQLFPSRYVHIGGDECAKDRWKACPRCQARIRSEGLADEHALQSYFIKRIGRYLNSLGKRLIGWDEILEGGLAPNATVMSWRGTTGGIAAAKAGHDVIMSPTTHCYLDYRQAEDKKSEPKAIGNTVLPLEWVYSYEPIPEELVGDERNRVLGTQGNVWTEYMPNARHVEYMTFPRLCALAEVAWTQPQGKDFRDFRRRMARHELWLRRLDVSYRPLEKLQAAPPNHPTLAGEGETSGNGKQE